MVYECLDDATSPPQGDREATFPLRKFTRTTAWAGLRAAGSLDTDYK